MPANPNKRKPGRGKLPPTVNKEPSPTVGTSNHPHSTNPGGAPASPSSVSVPVGILEEKDTVWVDENNVETDDTSRSGTGTIGTESDDDGVVLDLPTSVDTTLVDVRQIMPMTLSLVGYCPPFPPSHTQPLLTQKRRRASISYVFPSFAIFELILLPHKAHNFRSAVFRPSTRKNVWWSNAATRLQRSTYHFQPSH